MFLAGLILIISTVLELFYLYHVGEHILHREFPRAYLAAAQWLSQQAYEKVVAAQQANEWDMQGHAQKAKDLLDEANRELKQAAEAAKRNEK
jgi:hypothetical protein